MGLQITGQNVEILPTIRDYVEKKFGKLGRHFSNISSIKIELGEQKTKSPGQRYRVQVTVDTNGTLLRAEMKAENLMVAIDKVMPLVDRQVKKYKEKLQSKSKTGPSIRTAVKEKPATAGSPSLVRTKRFVIRPMSVDDAIDQMELLGHDFFLFHNSATKELNLIYRRKDGNYSIIESELE
ncbi:MAG: ribosome-associated translation inhibitor RaiA [Dehalococcoidales bacterium]|nr:ribosome-associated translation inhibitor RaiA [Dehalococcoidales bacterium]